MLRIWDVGSCRNLASALADRYALLAVAFSADGKLVASGGVEETIRLWDAETCQLRRELSGHSGPISFVRFSPDGGRVLSGSADKTLRLWDLSTGNCLVTLCGHSQMVLDGAFGPTGTRVVSGSSDGTLRIWETSGGREVLSLGGRAGGVTGVVFSPDGSQIVSSNEDGTVRLWKTAAESEGFAAHEPGDDKQTVSLTSEVGALVRLAKDSPSGVATAVEKARLLKAWPERSGDMLTYAEYLILGGDPKTAVTVIQRAIDKGGSHAWFYKSLIWALLSSGRTKEAERVFDTQMHLPGEFDDYAAACLLNRISAEELAKGYSDSYMNCFPWFYVGQRKEIEGKRDEAIAAYRKCMGFGRYPNVHWVSNWAAYRLEVLTGATPIPASGPASAPASAPATARYQEALKAQRAVLPPTDPRLAETLSALGYLLCSQGKPAEAEALPLETPNGTRVSVSMPWHVRCFPWTVPKEGADKPVQQRQPDPEAWTVLVGGPALLEQDVKAIAFYWGSQSPGTGVPADYFAVVATSRADLPAGRYRLKTLSDDGVRVWVEGKLVIDDWCWHEPKMDTAELDLAAGTHDFRIEYFEIDGGATLKFEIERLTEAAVPGSDAASQPATSQASTSQPSASP